MGQNRPVSRRDPLLRPVPAPAAALAAFAAFAAAVLVAGCAGWTTDPELTLHVDSGIDRPLLVYVNDDWVGTIPAGGHGGPPWTAEGRVASGTTLVTLSIPAAPTPGEGLTTTAALACGTITMTVGEPDPGPSIAPPAPGAERPSCE
jgi:hypothetical protein